MSFIAVSHFLPTFLKRILKYSKQNMAQFALCLHLFAEAFNNELNKKAALQNQKSEFWKDFCVGWRLPIKRPAVRKMSSPCRRFFEQRENFPSAISEREATPTGEMVGNGTNGAQIGGRDGRGHFCSSVPPPSLSHFTELHQPPLLRFGIPPPTHILVLTIGRQTAKMETAICPPPTPPTPPIELVQPTDLSNPPHTPSLTVLHLFNQIHSSNCKFKENGMAFVMPISLTPSFLLLYSNFHCAQNFAIMQILGRCGRSRAREQKKNWTFSIRLFRPPFRSEPIVSDRPTPRPPKIHSNRHKMHTF